MGDSNPQSETGTGTKPAYEPPPPLKIGGPAISEQPHGHGGKDKREHWIHKAPKFVEALCAIALVIITGTYTHYAGGQLEQLKESVRQAGDALILTRGQLAVASRNASVAENANTLADKSIKQSIAISQLDQRAWLGAKGFNVPDDMPKEIKEGDVTSIAASLTIENSGKTPAIHVGIEAGITDDVCGRPFPGNPMRELHPPVTRVIRSTVYPNSIQSSGEVHLPMNKAVLALLNSKSCVLYIFGRVTYCDIFGKYHFQHFCGEWVPGTKHQFDHCDAYNDSDSDSVNTKPQPCPFVK